MQRFCNSSFWDYDLTWNTNNPDFTPCFQKTALAWIPCLYLCIVSPFETLIILRSKNKNIPRSWINMTKFLCSLAIIILMIVQLKVTKNFQKSMTAEDYFYPIVIAVTVTLQTAMIVMERRRGVQSSGIIFVLWFLMCICFMPGMRTHALDLQVDGATVLNILYIVFYALTLMMFILNCFADIPPTYTKRSCSENPCPEDKASFLSILTFSWLDGLIWRGFRHTLILKDLWNISYENSSENISHCWEKNLAHRKTKKIQTTESSKKNKSQIVERHHITEATDSIFTILCSTFGSEILLGAVFKFFTDIMQFISPQILGLLMGFVDDENAYPWHGYLFAAILLVNAQLQTFFLSQYFKIMFTAGMRIRSAVVSSIYKKALRISNSERKGFSVGEIVNLMSVDAQRFMDLMPYLHMIWSGPLQICLAFGFLWHLLGPATLAGTGVMVLLIPINAYIANQVESLQANQMTQKDFRVKLMNEILNGIKVIKLYAWEVPFMKEILNARKKEITYLRKAAYYNVATASICNCAPFIVSLASFGVYTLISEKPLDARMAFVSLALFNLLEFPLDTLPSIISNVVQAKVSLSRMNRFLHAEELDQNAVNKIGDSTYIRNGTFTWDNQQTNPTLAGINVEIEKGKLVGIVGSVGAGKSSLCSAFLGEMNKKSGSVSIAGSVSYVAQLAWIQNDTLKNNILFGKIGDQKEYDSVIEGCALNADIEILPGGHDTEIGEKGINLSGGQKQRVSLGRAVYADTDIYILDDPLSAVDSHIGKRIFEKVIGPNGLLQKKTRLFVTHTLTHLRYMDHIVVMRDGAISEQGSYDELIAKKGGFQEFIVQYLDEKEEASEEEVDLEDLKHDLECSIGRSEFVRKICRKISHSSQDSNSLIKEARIFNNSLRLRPSKGTEGDRKIGIYNNKNKLIEDENMEVGKVPISVYRAYVKAAGLMTVVITLIGSLLCNSSNVGTNVWLAEWTKDVNETNPTSYYLAVYGSFGITQNIFILISSAMCYYGSFTAARVLHDQLLDMVLILPMSFFDTNPVGRILNRFSKDVDTIDTTVPYTFRWWSYCVMQLITTFTVIIFTTPMIVMVAVPVAITYAFLLILYVATSRQLKRMESITRSPIYSHFGETIQGASTIRAFGKTKEFMLHSQRIVDANQESYYSFIMGNRWLAMRLETLANIITFSAALFSVISKGNISAGNVGLSVSYAIMVTQVLNWFVRMSSEVETNLVSVERIKEYFDIKPEADWNILQHKPPMKWPQDGMVTFKDYATRYREGLDLVVKGVNFQTQPAEKIGIVGRTGAGKSSLTLGLFRIIEPAQGTIIIDGIDISKIGLHDLRSRLTIIPQDPVLFSGTMRLNLDPFNSYSDDILWNALDHAHLKCFVTGLPDGLHHEISEGGENLSVGQRQLVCLARALLRKTKVLILDEATAAVDMETDDLIQQTIRNEFKDCTILTIAHRLNTIMDADKVLVMDCGKVKEFDTPTNLLSDKTTDFYSMAKDADLV